MKTTRIKALIRNKHKNRSRVVTQIMKEIENLKKFMPKHEERNQLVTGTEGRVDKENNGNTTKSIIGFINDRFELRYNTVMGYVEYKQKGDSAAWAPVDARKTNGITMDAQLSGINAWDRDIKRYIMSDKVKEYNPIEEYLKSVEGKWDGKDHIALLANTVKTNNPHWHQWFRTWLLAMVAQWRGLNSKYGNSVAPLLISGQGFNKSTFCRSLLPDCLQWGYTDSMNTGSKQAMMQAMSQMLLVNLDEFNQISARTQEGFLKNLIQLASVKAKRPYGKHVEEFPRLASFIATTNITDVLADPSGNRRFIGVELTEPIDVTTPPNHDQLYAQILALLDSGERYWFDAQQTRMIMEHNRNYQLVVPGMHYFNELFEQCDDENQGRWMSTASILSHLRREYGATAITTNVVSLGKMLSAIDGMQRRRSPKGTEYLVRRV